MHQVLFRLLVLVRIGVEAKLAQKVRILIGQKLLAESAAALGCPGLSGLTLGEQAALPAVFALTQDLLVSAERG